MSRDLRRALLGLCALLLWEATGWDAVVSGWFGGGAGFALRRAAWLQLPLHDGLRLLAGAALLYLLLRVLRPGRLPRAAAAWCLGVTLLCMLGIAGFKSLTLSSCPWDLALFGGRADWVRHWQWGVADGGPGRCFPSGHATVGFAFFAAAFAWRAHDRQCARAWWWAACAVGTVAGLAQVARGAHFVSHVGWTAWLCWSACALLYRLGPSALRSAPGGATLTANP
jgi:membrane-associated PAP2 superfamily phosphatase